MFTAARNGCPCIGCDAPNRGQVLTIATEDACQDLTLLALLLAWHVKT
jgi:hypothetical protein